MARFSEKQQLKMFKELDYAMPLDFDCDEKMTVVLAPEDVRIESFEKLLRESDASEPKRTKLLVYFLITLIACRNPVSNEKITKLAERIIEAYKNRKIALDDLPMGAYALKLAQQRVEDGRIELPCYSMADVEEALAFGRELVVQGLYDKRDHLRREFYWDAFCGRFVEAREKIRVFLATPRTADSDCEGCELNALVHACLAMGDFENAETFMNEVNRKNLRCESDIPEKTQMQLTWLASERGDRDAGKRLKAAAKKLYADIYMYTEAALLLRAAQKLEDPQTAWLVLALFRPLVESHPWQEDSLPLFRAANDACSWLGDVDGAAWWAARAEEFVVQHGQRGISGMTWMPEENVETSRNG